MKKLILFALLLSNLVINAQRNNNISREDLYSLIKSDLSLLKEKAFNVCLESKSQIYQLKQTKDKNFEISTILKSVFSNNEMVPFVVPLYDSLGNFIESTTRYSTPWPKAMVKQKGQSDKIGFLFDSNSEKEEVINLFNNHCYFINIKDKEVNTSPRIIALMNFISSINEPCEVGTNQLNQSGNYLYFPIDFIDADTVQYIYEIVDMVFKTINKDFDKCYYKKGINNYYGNYDKCGKLQYEEKNNHEDSIDVLDVNTDTYQKKPYKSLENKAINAVALSFDNTGDAYPFPLYIGVAKNIVTTYGLDLGWANIYLKEKDIINSSSLISQKSFIYLKSIYQ
jgi:hypothetical protein